jgi:phage terminase large subunit-like protein
MQSKAALLASLPKAERDGILLSLTEEQREELLWEWKFWARPEQLPPEGDWQAWLVKAGRGFGKTRTGAEWVRGQIKAGRRRIALVAPTAADARDVMVEGDAGLLSVCWERDRDSKGVLIGRPIYEPSKRRVTWKNGAMAITYSADEPERLRGPSHDGAWCDELGAWRYAEAWDMLMFTMRLAQGPRTVVTTTPKPVPLMRKVLAKAGTVVTGGSTYDNAANLADDFLKQIEAEYEGTTLGRQEIHAELIDPSEFGLLKRPWWRKWIRAELPECSAILQSWDLSYGEKEEAGSFSACTTWGIFKPKKDMAECMILLDAWRGRVPFPELRRKAQDLYDDHLPDVVLVENKASGLSLVQELRKAGVPVRKFDPNATITGVRGGQGFDAKRVRAHASSVVLEGGRVWAPCRLNADKKTRNPAEFIEWAEAVIGECETFQGVPGEVNDYVDTCTQAWLTLRRGSVLATVDDEEKPKAIPKPARKAVYG